MKYRIERTSVVNNPEDYSVSFRLQQKRWWWPVWSYVKTKRVVSYAGVDTTVDSYPTLQEAWLALHLLKKKRDTKEQRVTYIYEEAESKEPPRIGKGGWVE